MLLRWLSRLGGVLLLSLAVSFTASAQYGGGSMGSGYGSNAKAIGIGVGVAAGAAVGIALYIHHRHHAAAKTAQSQSETSAVTQPEINRLSLKNDDDLYKTFSSTTAPHAGQHAEIASGAINHPAEAAATP